MKRAFTLTTILIAVIGVGLLVSVFNPLVEWVRPNGQRSSCQSNLKQIGLGFLQYVQDYDGKFPPTRVTSSMGWADVLQPYVKSTQLFQCPSAQSAMAGFSTDYFYNARSARVMIVKVRKPSLTILSGDGNDNAPTWNSWLRMPSDAATNPNSPAQRHLTTGNCLFADGHVKALRPGQVSSTFAPPTSRPTFATR